LLRELGGLGCAPLWAISSILLKSQTDKVDALRINALRGIFASVFLIAIVPIFGKVDQLWNLSLPALIYLWLSVIIGLVLGDTLYIKGMGIIGVARALPISITYPILVLPFSATIIGEDLPALTIVGVLVTAVGLYFITAPKRNAEREPAASRRRYWWGVFLLLVASLCWAAGTTILNFGMLELDPILAAALRMPFMTLVLFTIVFLKKGSRRTWYPGGRSLMILSLAGTIGIGLGGLLFMAGIKHGGVARTAILSSTAPLFGMPLSVLILHEKVTAKMVLGTVLCVIGIWLVVL
jgi:drug/metabolite transporter (DMT)-like permease